MSILVDRNTRLLVQGITGKEGSYHASRCAEYGSNLVAGVTPGKGNQVFRETIPIFDSVQQAIDQTKATASLIFVPPAFASDAVIEAVDAGIKIIACITEGIPVQDSIKVMHYIKDKDVTLIGPNCPGIISPGEHFKMGIMPGHIHKPGRTGVVSRSGTLTYEAVKQLSDLDIGQSTCVGIGGDPVSGATFTEILSAPEGKRMGHAGAIITGSHGKVSEKIKSLESAGVAIIPTPGSIGTTMESLLSHP